MRSFLIFSALFAATASAVRVSHPHAVIRDIASRTGSGTVQAGVARIDATLPLGAPLAGYNHGGRQAPFFPIPDPKQYTTFMAPSVGVLDPNYARAVVIDDGSGTRIAMVTMDAIGANGPLLDMAYSYAASEGFTVPRDAVTLHASHSHSGPGAIAADFLWSIAPATDLMVPELQMGLARKIASALVEAEKALAPAKIGIAQDDLVGVTKNRRAKIPNSGLLPGTVDPHYTVMRIDNANTGSPIATVHNLAIHGVCQGPSNMKFSSDIMGGANKLIEENVGGVSLFINADAGDIDPAEGMCDKNATSPNGYVGSEKMAAKVAEIRASIAPQDTAKISYVANVVDLGPTSLNLTFARTGNCTHGGFVDICTICRILDCDANIHLFSSWIENSVRFTGFRFDVGSETWALATLPGEPLLELGWWVRNATRDLGFKGMFLAGYSNNHIGYMATPDQYMLGGYESELTFWGIDEARNMLNHVTAVLKSLMAQ